MAGFHLSLRARVEGLAVSLEGRGIPAAAVCFDHNTGVCLPLPFWIAPATRFLGTTRVRVLSRMILPGASPSARAASTLHAQLQRAGLSLLAQHAARARRLELARAARGRRVNVARSSLHALVCTRGFKATSVRSRMQAGMMLLPASSAWCLGLNATTTRCVEGYCVIWRHIPPGRERPKFKHCCC